MRWLVLILLVGTANAQAHLDTARTYIGTVEVGTNAGPEVTKFLASTGLGPGYAWCSALVSYCLSVAEPKPYDPTKRTARAQGWINRSGYRASDVLRGSRTVPPGWIGVWKKGNGPYGHVGLVDEQWSGRCGWMIEGNTSSGQAGSQRDGDGVYRRYRCITPGSYFRLVGFYPVRYR